MPELTLLDINGALAERSDRTVTKEVRALGAIMGVRPEAADAKESWSALTENLPAVNEHWPPAFLGS